MSDVQPVTVADLVAKASKPLEAQQRLRAAMRAVSATVTGSEPVKPGDKGQA